MNKKKKLNQIHTKRVKAAKAKGSGKKKDPYISKAERARLEELELLEKWCLGEFFVSEGILKHKEDGIQTINPWAPLYSAPWARVAGKLTAEGAKGDSLPASSVTKLRVSQADLPAVSMPHSGIHARQNIQKKV